MQTALHFLNDILFYTILIFSFQKINASFMSLENLLPHEVKEKFKTLP